MRLLKTGLVYRNPKPHLRAVHAWHPSVVTRNDGNLLAAFDLGQGPESLDYRTWFSRSTDGGDTWSPPERLFDEPMPRLCTHTMRLASVGDGTIVGFGGRFYRDNPDEGLVNRDNLGYVPMDLITIVSRDQGLTWEPPTTLDPPLVGPGFEICHRILELADGRWLAPTATWKGWDGSAPHGMQAIALVSHDRGETWPEWIPIANQYDRGVISWEQGLTQLPDGRLLAVVWSYNERTGTSEPSRYTISSDGHPFGPLRENGLLGETAKIITLRDGRVLCAYRRLDKPGLWASLVEVRGDEWINCEELLLWQGSLSGMFGKETASDELSGLKFGFPSLVQLPDGDVFLVFWCEEKSIHNIRWVRIGMH